MKYERSDSFLQDLSRLPSEHYAPFKEAVCKHFLPALAQGAHAGHVPWPVRLRIHKLASTDVYSMAWHFAPPDGRQALRDGGPRRSGERGVIEHVETVVLDSQGLSARIAQDRKNLAMFTARPTPRLRGSALASATAPKVSRAVTTVKR
ncbi:hypothetical protein [Nonomuraea basaltis]|uniref:hypothetical protein n=1 Tax=Nonomuraea basaltis TaxID=2495887 RepID=UPI00197DFC38|nr:hypothetical protein [Nonomuraea basaltis]